MDSLTQAALGAAVGTAVLGRRLGPRRAALAGAVLGTLPDLDVFWPFDDPVDAFVLHRGATHSLVVQALATPLFGEALVRGFRALREHRRLAWAAVYLCLSTHALLDAMTVYGTRLLWPLWTEPVGVGSVFIIDPLYTLPLLVAVVWALCLRAWTPRFGRVLAAALALSTGYLGWGVAAQGIARDRADAVLAEAGIAPERTLATPTPFNTLFWRVIAIDGDRYLNLYVPLLGGADAVTAYVHPRGGDGCLAGVPVAGTLSRFAHGFVRYERSGADWRVADLRMGLTPSYVFRFAVAADRGGIATPVAPARVRTARSGDGDVDWLLAGMAGRAAVRTAERDAALDLDAVRLAARPAPTLSC
ncbi:membrane protein [Thalassobaculum fulvum]|uniref:Membrane protein n=1 Tax=Thalassobaculum fulvum TaxID=1633335 RepID=A0A918XYC7_9PROT|nr:metal-dependent hydrolase [Thalassobaculum fulvum]GHD64149.1 membrane protein [Thalassobaculum fulvum]